MASVLPRIPYLSQVLTPSEPLLGSRPSRRGTPPTILLMRQLLTQPGEAKPRTGTQRGTQGLPRPITPGGGGGCRVTVGFQAAHHPREAHAGLGAAGPGAQRSGSRGPSLLQGWMDRWPSGDTLQT